MFRTFLTVATFAALGMPLALADESLQRELDRDVILRAMADELTRSKSELMLGDLERPYYIEYVLVDGIYARIRASLGAVTQRGVRRIRPFRSDVRVGSYELDNTNFSSGGGFHGSGRGADMPIENDYAAIRQAIWWISDLDYKGVSEDIVRKRAFMESKLIEDKPHDFSREEPIVHFEASAPLAIEMTPLENIAVELSAVFRNHPEIRESSVETSGAIGNKYMVNTEGSRLRTVSRMFSINVSATVQSDDGMLLGDARSFQAFTLGELPPIDEMLADCRSMIVGLVELKNAPTLDSYTGPILFDAEPATSVFGRQFAGSFPGGQRNVGSRTSPHDFSKKIGQRILPRSVTVVDDPTLETIGETRAFGHYLIDDQGVRPQSITLVENGKLKAQLMSRNPSKEFSQSTGHGRGVYQAQASIANLIVTTTDGLDATEMRQALAEACEDEGLAYGIRVASLGNIGGGGRFYGGRRGGGPLFVYKVYPDGKEELVRGVEMTGLNLKAFKRLLALGDTPHVRNVAGRSGGAPRTLAVPALLFEELDLTKIDRDFDKPPILPPPAARAKTKAQR